jgi:5-methyltetrahydropteroyltriglutamate--homocysteine methyltransferase
MKSATLGYPRIGASRELKRAQEQHWAGVISAAALREIGDALEAGNVDAQAAAGVGLVGVGDHTLYDHVLDWTARLGAAPARFGDGPAEVGGDVYFAMARGKEGVAALDMSKFLGTNYHYMVNEIGKGFAVRPDFTEFVGRIAGAVARVGSARVSPIVLGPVTYAALARLSGGVTAEEVVRVLTPAYRRLLEELKAVGVGEVQMHEPALVLGGAEKLREQFKAAYEVLAGAGVPLHVVTYFDDVPAGVLDWVVRLPGVVAVSLDFTRGDNLRSVREVEFPAGVRLGAGVLDARSVWDDEVEGRLLLEEVKGAVGERVEVCVQPSASLQFLPVDLDAEDGLAPEVKGRLAFAKQKVEALVRIAGGAGGGSGGTGGRDAGGVCGGGGEVAGMKIDEAWFSRVPFEERRPRQFSVDGGYGTTTIGSFPQTPEIRRLRSRLKAGKLGKEQYDAEIDKQIAFMIGVQEALGLDVFVHGEPERTDMVRWRMRLRLAKVMPCLCL